MEKLAALCCLWVFGFGTKAEYTAELDSLFLEDPKNDFLLELEDLGNDGAAAWEKISPLVESSLNADKFGKELFAALEKIYNETRLAPLEFGERRLHMLYNLPRKISDNEAFDYYKEKP